MDSNFGAPVYDTTDDPAVQAALTTAAVEIDPNDPRLTSESMETDATVDAYAIPPPLPDGKWRAKLSLADIKNPAGQIQEHRFLLTMATWTTPPAPFFAMNIESNIIDLREKGSYDGTKLVDYWVKTLVGDRKVGASPLATVIRKSGGTVPLGANPTQVRDIALKHFAGDPETIIETQWEVRCQTCEKTADTKGDKKPKPYLRGMHRFPSRGPGKFDPEVKCGVCGSLNRAMPKIMQYFTLTEAQPTYK